MMFGLWDMTQSVPTVLEGNESEPVAAEFKYSAEEPYAVTAVFTARDVDVEWTFARDLLSEGMLSGVGDGDVMVTPDRSGRIKLILRSPEGAAALLCERNAVASFVEHMFTLVPAGEETARLDLDGLITELTA